MLLLDGRSLQIAGDQLEALQPNLVRSHAAAGYDVAIATTEREAIRLPMQEG
jgi:urocanate hydratase